MVIRFFRVIGVIRVIRVVGVVRGLIWLKCIINTLFVY